MPSGGSWQRSTTGSSRQAHGKHACRWGSLQRLLDHMKEELTVARQCANPWPFQKRPPAVATSQVSSALLASSAASEAWSLCPVFHVQCDEQHISHNFDVRKGRIFTEFFKGGKTNVAYNCLDRFVLSTTTLLLQRSKHMRRHGLHPCCNALVVLPSNVQTEIPTIWPEALLALLACKALTDCALFCGRHVEAGCGDVTCFLWEGNEPGHDRKMSYKEVLAEVSKLVRWQAGHSAAAGPSPRSLSSISSTDSLASLHLHRSQLLGRDGPAMPCEHRLMFE